MNSPLFPPLLLVPNNSQDVPDVAYTPQLPEKPTAATSTIQVYIIPTESNIFVEGFETDEYADRPPALLRGCLYIRVLKQTRIKSIALEFKGQQRTDWPEGIPPKRTVYLELNDIISHTWPFYQQNSTLPNNGADIFTELPDQADTTTNTELSNQHSPSQEPPQSGGFLRSLSPSFMRRAVSPSPDNTADITTVLSGALALGPNEPGTFAPGDYIYNFEHPLRPSIPETCSATFGEVHYQLEAVITRSGAFKSNITARHPITIVRVLSEHNLEENEPIVITRDWEDQLRYDIVIGAKSIVLNLYLPLAFRFVPLWGKVALHRVRVYLTENMEYYCRDKKVHRMEPQKKFLLMEHKARKGESLLAEGVEGDDDYEVLPKELEFQLYVPHKLTGKHNHTIHPNTSLDNIQAHHWIKICLRILRKNPDDEEKRKHYEILIDLPLRVLSPLAAHGNTLLPAYDMSVVPQLSAAAAAEPQLVPVASPPMTPGVQAVNHGVATRGRDFLSATRSHSSSVDSFQHLLSHNESVVSDADMHLESNLYAPEQKEDLLSLSPQALPHPDTFSPTALPVQRPIHLLRKPSYAPPSFDEGAPPAYTEGQNRALSLSPLRIDEGGQMAPVLLDVNMVPAPQPADAPIRDLLRGQLMGRSRAGTESTGSDASKLSRSRAGTESSEKSSDRRSLESKKEKEKREGDERNGRSERNGEEGLLADSRTSRDSRASRDSRISRESRNSRHSNTLDEQSNTLDGSSQGPLTELSSSQPDSGTIPSVRLHPPVDSDSEGSIDPMDIEGVVLGEDLTEYTGLPVGPMRPLSPVRRSRRSSSSSESTLSLGLPHEQTIPLLNLSLTSVNSVRDESAPFHVNGYLRNGSINTLALDFGRRNSQPFVSTQKVDLMGGGDLGGPDTAGGAGDLLGLRNPRLKKHYQFADPFERERTPPPKIFGVTIKSPVEEREESDDSQGTVKEKDKEKNEVDGLVI